MPNKFGAGRLVETVAFEKRGGIADGYGNTKPGPFVEQYRCRAAFIHLRGGSETIMQARLESHPSIIVRIRRSAAALEIREDWQARDVRTGTRYNVKGVTNDNSRAVLDILCEANIGG